MIQATSAKTPSLFSPASISITPKFKLFAMFLIKVPAGIIFENISYNPSSAIMTSTVDFITLRSTFAAAANAESLIFKSPQYILPSSLILKPNSNIF